MYEETKKEKKLIQVEAQLLEQEHRLISCLTNFFSRKKWTKDDPRRKATIISLLWRLFPFSSAST